MDREIPGDKAITRRSFIGRAAKGAAGIAASTGLGMGGVGLARALADSVISAGDRDEVDYIVVGSGAGGGPVACNLARAGKRVAILEAGTQSGGDKYRVPSFHLLSTEEPTMAWNFFVRRYTDLAIDSRNSKYVKDKGVLYPRAGTLGGCTAHNALITLYPDNQDWTDIQNITGDSSWAPSEMRRYFERIERARYFSARTSDNQRHGFDGWLGTEVSDPQIALRDPKLIKIFLAAAEEAGLGVQILSRIARGDFNFPLDPNDWQRVVDAAEGLFMIPKATSSGQRNGTREALLAVPHGPGDFLSIRTGCLATRILFDPDRPTRVIGVEYEQGEHLYSADPSASDQNRINSKTKRIFARQEVILAGGAFNSPQLLMLSGIGPREHLDRIGIPARLDLPGVGRNLQDRYEVGVVTQFGSDFSVLRNCTFGRAGDPCLKEYEKNPVNTPYSTNGIVAGLIKRSDRSKDLPDLCVFGAPSRFKGYYPGYSVDAQVKNQFTWAVLKGHTRNTAGSVELRSANPFDTPDINFRYFEDGKDLNGEDMQGVLQGLKIARRIHSKLAVALMGPTEVIPGRTAKTDQQLKDFIRDESWGHHASCSNKMGPKSDPMAVVDAKFRVHGTEGLRVVDASVFPRVPGLFIVVPTYIIAEKASDVILWDSMKV